MSSLSALLSFPLGDDLHGEWRERYARQLWELWPPGLWDREPTSVLHRFLLATAEEPSRLHLRAQDLLIESDPTQTSELLADFERVLGIVPGSADSDELRRNRVVARLVARQRYRPADFQRAVAPILRADPPDVQVLERSRADAVAMAAGTIGDGMEREIHRFFVYVPVGINGGSDDAELIASQLLVDDIKPAHTQGHVIETVDLRCDHPDGLCDRDLIGV